MSPPFSEARPLTHLIGLGVEELLGQLGPPEVEHRQGDDTWLIFNTSRMALRIRCGGSPVPRVASCTASLSEPVPTLSEATAHLGLWPACEPEIDASAVAEPAVRRAVPGPRGERYSLMATVRAGRFSQVTVFDEEPEWAVDQ